MSRALFPRSVTKTRVPSWVMSRLLLAASTTVFSSNTCVFARPTHPVGGVGHPDGAVTEVDAAGRSSRRTGPRWSRRAPRSPCRSPPPRGRSGASAATRASRSRSSSDALLAARCTGASFTADRDGDADVLAVVRLDLEARRGLREGVAAAHGDDVAVSRAQTRILPGEGDRVRRPPGQRRCSPSGCRMTSSARWRRWPSPRGRARSRRWPASPRPGGGCAISAALPGR